MAVEYHPRAVEVGCQRDRLSHAHGAELRLLEIGVDPNLIERHYRHQRRASADALAELHVAPGDEAGYGRRYDRARISEICRMQTGCRIADSRVALDGRTV